MSELAGKENYANNTESTSKGSVLESPPPLPFRTPLEIPRRLTESGGTEVPGGKQVSRSIEAVLASGILVLDPVRATQLSAFASWVGGHGIAPEDGSLSPNHPVLGYLDKCSIFAGLISPSILHAGVKVAVRGFDTWMPAVILWGLLRGESSPVLEMASRLARDDDILDSRSRLTALILAVGKTFTGSGSAGLIDLRGMARPELAKAAAMLKLLRGFPNCSSHPRKAGEEIRAASDAPPDLLAPGGARVLPEPPDEPGAPATKRRRRKEDPEDRAMELRDPNALLDEDREVLDPTERLLQAERKAPSRKRSRAWDFDSKLDEDLIRRFVQLRLAGALVPGSDRTFATLDEARTIIEQLLERQAEAVRAKDIKRSLACAALVMKVLVSRRDKAVAWLIVELVRCGACSSKQLNIAVDSVGFWANSPRQGKAGANDRIFFSWPGPFAKVLKDLGRHRIEKLPACGEIVDAMRDTISELRVVVPSATQDRLSYCVTDAIYRVLQDIRIAQLVAGDSLEHTTAPLSYLWVAKSTLEEIYRAAVSALWGAKPEELFGASIYPASDVDPNSSPDQFVGPVEAYIPDPLLRRCVASMAKSVREAAFAIGPASIQKNRNTLEAWVRFHNELTQYTMTMQADALGPRINRHLTGLSSDHIVEICDGSGLAAMCDKPGAGGSAFRCSVVPGMLISQVGVIRQSWQVLLCLQSEEEIRSKISSILKGHGSLFQRVVPVSAGKRGKARWVAKPFGASALHKSESLEGLNPKHLRHRLITKLFVARAAAEDVSRHVGHSTSCEWWSEEDPDSPIAYVKRLAPFLEDILKSDGFEVLGAERVRAAIRELQSNGILQGQVQADRASDDWLRSLKWEKKIREAVSVLNGKSNAVLKAYRKLHDKEAGEAVEEALTHQIAGYAKTSPPSNVVVDAATSSIIRRRVVQRHQDTGWYYAGIAALRARLTELVKDQRWAVSRFPLELSRASTPTPRLHVGTLSAYRTCLHLLRWIEEVGGDPTRSGGHRVAALMIDVVIRMGIFRFDRFQQVLVALKNPIADASGGARWLINLALSDDPPISTAVEVPSAIAVWAKCDPKIIERCATLSQSDLDEQLSKYGPREGMTSEKLFDLAALGRRVIRGGTLACVEDDTLIAPTLSAERLRVLKTGEISWCYAEAEPQSAASRQLPEDGLTKTRGRPSYYDEVRKLLGARSKAAGRENQEALNTLLERPDACDSGTTQGVVMAWLRRHLDKVAAKQIVLRTIYTYWTTTMRRLLDASPGINWCSASTEEWLQILDRAQLTGRDYMRLSKRDRAVLQSILDEVAACGGPDIVASAWCDEDGGPETWPRGYLISPKEVEALESMLRRVAKSPLLVSAKNARELELVSSNLRRFGVLGLRTSELCGLLERDVRQGTGGITTVIKGRHKRGLKTEASARILYHTWDELDLPVRNAGEGRSEQVSEALWLRELGLEHGVIEDRLRSILHPAMQALLGRQDGRYYAFRHGRCNELLWSLLPDEMAAIAGVFPDSQHPAQIQALLAYPPHQRLRYVARQMGHGPPLTCVRHYSIGLLRRHDSDRGLPEVSLPGVAIRINVRLSSLKVTASRRGIVPSRISARELVLNLVPEVKCGTGSVAGTDLSQAEVEHLALRIRRVGPPVTASVVASLLAEFLLGKRDCQELDARHGVADGTALRVFNLVKATSLGKRILSEGAAKPGGKGATARTPRWLRNRKMLHAFCEQIEALEPDQRDLITFGELSGSPAKDSPGQSEAREQVWRLVEGKASRTRRRRRPAGFPPFVQVALAATRFSRAFLA